MSEKDAIQFRKDIEDRLSTYYHASVQRENLSTRAVGISKKIIAAVHELLDDEMLVMKKNRLKLTPKAILALAKIEEETAHVAHPTELDEIDFAVLQVINLSSQESLTITKVVDSDEVQ